MIAIFLDMLHGCLEDYVDEIVVKFKEAYNHVNDMKKLFVKCKQCKLRMNPLNVI